MPAQLWAGSSAVKKSDEAVGSKWHLFKGVQPLWVRLRRGTGWDLQLNKCCSSIVQVYAAFAFQKHAFVFSFEYIFVGTGGRNKRQSIFVRWHLMISKLRCRSGTGFLFGHPPSDHTWQFSQRQRCMTHAIWVVVSNTFYIHPYLGKWSNLTNIFQMGWNHQLGMFVIDLNLGPFPWLYNCELKWPRQDPSRQQDLSQASYSIMLCGQVFGMLSC